MENIKQENTKGNKETHDSSFVIVPHHYATDKNIDASEKFFLGILTSLSIKHGYCFATNEYFENTYGFSSANIRTLLEKLETKKYLKREVARQKNNKWKTERRIYLMISDPVKINMVEGVKSNMVEGVKSNMVEPVKSNVYNSINNNKTYKDNIYTEQNDVLLNDEDKKLSEEIFIPLDEKIEKDTRFVSMAKRPLKKYPDIWLSLSDFKYIRKCLVEAEINPGKVFARVKLKLDSWKATGRSIDQVDSASWLVGWALDAQMESEAKNLKLNFYKGDRK